MDLLGVTPPALALDPIIHSALGEVFSGFDFEEQIAGVEVTACAPERDIGTRPLPRPCSTLTVDQPVIYVYSLLGARATLSNKSHSPSCRLARPNPRLRISVVR